jgi:hypothetical protein
MTNTSQQSATSLGGLRPSSVVLLIGIGFEAACAAVGVWITSWYRLNTALFDASMNCLGMDFLCYLALLIIVPLALSYVEKESEFRNIAIFLFSWIAFIFVFLAFNSIPLL